SAIPLPMSPHPSTATLRISAISPPPDFRVLQMKPAGIWGRVLAGSTPAGEPLFEPAEEPATPIRGRRDERLPVLQPIEEPFDLDAGPGRLLAEMGACDRDTGGDAAAQHSAERDHAGRDRAVGTDQIDRGPAGHGREPTADQGAEDPARYRAASHGVPPLVGKVHRHADVCRLSVERLYGERNTMSAGQLEATLVAGERPGDLGDEVFGRSIPAATLLPAQRVQVLPGREVLVEGSVDQV